MSEEQKQAGDENFEEMLARHEAAATKLQAGQKISGTVIEVGGDSVFIDLGVKQDGVMDRSEILDKDGNEIVKKGDQIEAWIVALTPQGARLSRSMAGSGVAALEDARDAGIPVEGRVTGTCKGGYEIDVLGKRAFCPGSQMEMLQGEEPESVVGRHMQFLIMRIENHGRNIVVSRRALIERERAENLDKLLSGINVGDVVSGRITRTAPFGAFVELAPSVEGLIHISELSWTRVASPDEIVAPGDEISAKVTSIVKDDKGQTRIGLSAKQAMDDPWNSISSRFAIGDIVEGKVQRLAPFGAFVEIAPGVEGLAHISELSWEKRIAKPEEVLAPGDIVSVKIKEIVPESRRISLSLKDAKGDPWLNIPDEFSQGAVVGGRIESKSQHGLFVRLAPGLVGLVPQTVLEKLQAFSGLGAGDAVEVVIRNIDPQTRRISLGPVSQEAQTEKEDTSWKRHMVSAPAARSEGSGIMAAALAKAFQKKR